MRIWIIHPKYLDPHNLVAFWRSALLCQDLLSGKTYKGVKRAGMDMFKKHSRPLAAISYILHMICDEGVRRKYQFDRSRIIGPLLHDVERLDTTRGQLQFEIDHLRKKLSTKIVKGRETLDGRVEHISIFNIIEGNIEPWEKVWTQKATSTKSKRREKQLWLPTLKPKKSAPSPTP